MKKGGNGLFEESKCYGRTEDLWKLKYCDRYFTGSKPQFSVSEVGVDTHYDPFNVIKDSETKG